MGNFDWWGLDQFFVTLIPCLLILRGVIPDHEHRSRYGHHLAFAIFHNRLPQKDRLFSPNDLCLGYDLAIGDRCLVFYLQLKKQVYSLEW